MIEPGILLENVFVWSVVLALCFIIIFGLIYFIYVIIRLIIES